jgi:hypothetical protein
MLQIVVSPYFSGESATSSDHGAFMHRRMSLPKKASQLQNKVSSNA